MIMLANKTLFVRAESIYIITSEYMQKGIKSIVVDLDFQYSHLFHSRYIALYRRSVLAKFFFKEFG